MAHISLYRRYRPTSFDEVIGQGHIVRTLVNQIKTDNISHAYLFTGTRGTGKTTVARIFARAINCENPVNGNPCGKCSACVELQKPGNMDILEIDAASNSTVDEIRDLREKVKYPPVIGKYKVYIIDEVHMLSTSAFNALLKTLEEPPSHAVFILATTDVHKLPQTILSRCMRFDFKLLSVKDISDNLKRIFDDIGKKYSEEAINLIATSAEGSVRDSLSIADMCASYSGDTITYDDVLEVLGASDPHIVLDLVQAVLSHEVARALSIVDNLSNFGKNIAVLNKDVATTIRNVIYVKNCKKAESALKLPKDIYEKLSAISESSGNVDLLNALDLFNGLSGELRYSTQPRIMFEATVVRAALENGEAEIEKRLKKLESAVSQGAVNTAFQKKNELKTDNPDALWDACRTEIVGKERCMALGIAMNKYVGVEENGNFFKVSFKTKADASVVSIPDNLKLIESKLGALSGKPYKLTVKVTDDDTSEDVLKRLKTLFGDDFKITK